MHSKLIETKLLIQNSLDSPLGSASIAGFIRQNEGVSFDRPRTLGHYAIVLILRGSGRFSDKEGEFRSVKAGHGLLLFPDIPHAYGPGLGEEWDEIYIVFSGPVFELWRAQGLLDPNNPVLALHPIDYWMRRMEETVDRRTQFGDGASEACKLQQLLSDMLDHQSKMNVNDADQMWLALAMAELQDEHAHEALDWDAMSERFGMTYAGFRKRFTRLSGVPPARYLSRQIIARASKLMQQHKSNKEIAQVCGFCDEFHFSRRFKQVTGLSPTEFRRHLPSMEIARIPH